MSPLMYAVWNKNIPMVELLLENGANADLWAYRSPTAVMLAYKSGNNELIALLEKYSRLSRKKLDKIKETASKLKALDKPYLGHWFDGIIVYP
jgi:ankyrin repeat protein